MRPSTAKPVEAQRRRRPTPREGHAQLPILCSRMALQNNHVVAVSNRSRVSRIDTKPSRCGNDWFRGAARLFAGLLFAASRNTYELYGVQARYGLTQCIFKTGLKCDLRHRTAHATAGQPDRNNAINHIDQLDIGSIDHKVRPHALENAFHQLAQNPPPFDRMPRGPSRFRPCGIRCELP